MLTKYYIVGKDINGDYVIVTFITQIDLTREPFAFLTYQDARKCIYELELHHLTD